MANSETILKIKKVFDENPEKRYSIYSLYKKTNSNYTSIRNIVDRLHKLGYIEYDVVTKTYKRIDENEWVE